MRAPLIRNRRAMDAEIEEDKVTEMVGFLRTKLSAEDFRALKGLVGISDDAEDKKLVAADSALDSFAKRWPSAARIGLV